MGDSIAPSDLLAETVLTLAEAAKQADTSVSVVYRWINDGLRGGIKLEACLRGSRWVTSAEALGRFYNRLTAARHGEPVDSTTPHARTAAQRRRDSERAARECAELGA